MNNLDRIKSIAWYKGKNKKNEWVYGFLTCDLKGNARIYNPENKEAMFQEVEIDTIEQINWRKLDDEIYKNK